jgi:hypothetical protein
MANNSLKQAEAQHDATMALLKAIKTCAESVGAHHQTVNQYAMAANNLASAVASLRGK